MKDSLRNIAKTNRSKITFDNKTKKLFIDNFYLCLNNILSNYTNITNIGLYYPIFNEISPLEFVKYFRANDIIIALNKGIDSKPINKPKQIIKEEIRKPPDPLNVFVCPNVLYFPFAHDFPTSAAMGSLIAKIKIGVTKFRNR